MQPARANANVNVSDVLQAFMPCLRAFRRWTLAAAPLQHGCQSEARAIRGDSRDQLTAIAMTLATVASRSSRKQPACDNLSHRRNTLNEQVKFALVEAEKATFPVEKLCKCLGVSRSGSYAWRRRPASDHRREDERLRILVREARERSRRTYGSPRVHAELAAKGERVSRKRIVRLMQEQDLVARKRRRYKCTTMSEHDQPVAPNLLQGDFTAPAPNQRG
jgi:hypothetical protein